jgi:predicted Ser/Thr protein kinase
MLPSGCPAELSRALEQRGATLDEHWEEGARTYMRVHDRDGAKLFARFSSAPADRATIAIEARVRQAVGAEGALRAPRVEAWGDLWMVERAIESEPLRGPEAIDLVLAAAERLARLELPDVPEAEGADGGEGRWQSAVRRLRMARSPLPMRDVVRARAIVSDSSLPRVTTHGDFHEYNVLVERGAAWVIDWELADAGPAGFDLMQMWASLESEADRERLYAGALEIVGHRHADGLAAMRYALTVRTIAGLVSSRHSFNRDDREAGALLDMLSDLRPGGA